MQIICRILQLSDISIMAVERDKSRREGILLRMSTRDSVPLKEKKIYFNCKSHEEINEAIIHKSNIGRLLERFYAALNLMKLLIAHGNTQNLS